METLRRKFLLALGWLIIAFGLALGPIPGPGGIPIVAGGAMLVLSQSHSARKLFVRLQRRYPKTLGPVRAFLRKKKRNKADTE